MCINWLCSNFVSKVVGSGNNELALEDSAMVRVDSSLSCQLYTKMLRIYTVIVELMN